jgi:hypothetical protein
MLLAHPHTHQIHRMAEAAPKRKRRVNDVPAVMRIPPLEKAQSLLAKRLQAAVVQTNGCDDESLHCLIDQGMHQNGYPSCSWHHKETNIQVSHLVLRVQGGEDAVPKRALRETASHLCHNKSCIRFDHIIKESVGNNGRRNGCLAFVESPCCGVKLNACGHHPRCILPFAK